MKKIISMIFALLCFCTLNACTVERAADLKSAIQNLVQIPDTSKPIIMQPAVELPENLQTTEAFIAQNHYPENELIICTFDASQEPFGAIADGQTDCTQAINAALQQTAQKGGGCVYLPEGKYLIQGTIQIPTGVSLCGDWVNPEQEPAGTKGTILIGGEGLKTQPAFVKLDGSANGILNITLMYQEQNLQTLQEYPVTITQPQGDSATVQNVTIVNGNNAICLGSENASQLHTIKNVYISCLGTALSLDRIYDIGRLENIHVSAAYWQENQIIPVENKSSIADAMFEQTTGFLLKRSDWEYTYDMYLTGLKNGVIVTKTDAEGTLTGSNAKFTGLYITDCDTGLTVEHTNDIGLTFTYLEITTQNRDCISAIQYQTGHSSFTQYVECKFDGNFSQLFDGADSSSFSPFTHCTFRNTQTSTPLFKTQTSKLAFHECKFENEKIFDQVPSSIVASFTDCSFTGSPDFGTAADSAYFQNDLTKTNMVYTSKRKHQYIENTPLSYTKTLLSITSFGAKANDDTFDNAPIIQAALDQCAEYGGGVVYIPQGQYTVKGHLTVPEGVLLSGCFMTPVHANYTVNASTLRVYADIDNPDGQSLITLSSHSGVKGFAIRYPGILSEDGAQLLHTYPYSIQSNGDGCYAMYITTPFAYQFIDFGSNPSPNHYIQYCSGCVFGTGIFAGNNSKNGWIENCHFNPNYAFSAGETVWGPIDFALLSQNSTTFVFGYNKSEHVLGTFVYGTSKGMYFIEQDGKSTNGTFIAHGSDYADMGICVEECGTIEMINAQIAPFGAGQTNTYFYFDKKLKGERVHL